MKTKMKTTLLFCLFPLLLFLVAHADDPGATDLKCSKKTIAELGKDVTLDCYCEPRCDVTGEELKWKFNQKTNVLAYIGDYNLGEQDLQFKGRAQVSSTERLKDGNFPVTISKVIKSDEGNYTCHVGSKTCSVELKELKLKCPKKTVEALVGQNVTLNCKSEPPLDLTEEIITWKFNSTIVQFKKTKVVYMYRLPSFHGEKPQDDQDDQFRGRVHNVSDWKVSEGKLSVEISSLNENDTGNYTCSVVHVSKCTVTLTVEKEDKQTSGAQGDNIPTTTDGAQGDNTTTTSEGPDPGTKIGIVAGVLVAAVIGALTCLIYRYRKSLLSCIGTQRGGEQDERRPAQDNQEAVPLQTENQLPAIHLQPLNPTQN